MSSRDVFNQLVATMDAILAEPPMGGAKGRTRARVLRAATKLFQHQGYRRTSVDEVALEAGVAKGTVYVHFKNKHDLMYHAILEEKRGYMPRFRDLLAAQLAPAERLERYIELTLMAVHEAPLSARLTSGDREMLAFLDEMPESERATFSRTQTSSLDALLTGVGAYDQLSAEEKARRRQVVMTVMLTSTALMDERLREGLSARAHAAQLAKALVQGIAAP